MIPALVDGELRRATPGARGNCPECGDPVYARIPDHAIRHWAHNPLPDGEERICSHDAGEMTEWHREWQDRRTDVICIEKLGPDRRYRADVVTEAGHIVEFQHSSIKLEEVEAREQYWRIHGQRGCWVLDGTSDDDERVSVRRKPEQPEDDPWRRFEWPRAPLLLYRAKWPCWIDLDERGLIQVSRMEQNRSPRAGHGWLVSTDWFINEVINGKRLTLRTHKPQTHEQKVRQVGHARKEEASDLYVVPGTCLRMDEVEQWTDHAPADVVAAAIYAAIPGECCGQHYPGHPGGPLIAACQLCSNSPSYYQGGRHAVGKS